MAICSKRSAWISVLLSVLVFALTTHLLGVLTPSWQYVYLEDGRTVHFHGLWIDCKRDFSQEYGRPRSYYETIYKLNDIDFPFEQFFLPRLQCVFKFDYWIDDADWYEHSYDDNRLQGDAYQHLFIGWKIASLAAHLVGLVCTAVSVILLICGFCHRLLLCVAAVLVTLAAIACSAGNVIFYMFANYQDNNIVKEEDGIYEQYFGWSFYAALIGNALLIVATLLGCCATSAVLAGGGGEARRKATRLVDCNGSLATTTNDETTLLQLKSLNPSWRSVGALGHHSQTIPPPYIHDGIPEEHLGTSPQPIIPTHHHSAAAFRRSHSAVFRPQQAANPAALRKWEKKESKRLAKEQRAAFKRANSLPNMNKGRGKRGGGGIGRGGAGAGSPNPSAASTIVPFYSSDEEGIAGSKEEGPPSSRAVTEPSMGFPANTTRQFIPFSHDFPPLGKWRGQERGESGAESVIYECVDDQRSIGDPLPEGPTPASTMRTASVKMGRGGRQQRVVEQGVAQLQLQQQEKQHLYDRVPMSSLGNAATEIGSGSRTLLISSVVEEMRLANMARAVEGAENDYLKPKSAQLLLESTQFSVEEAANVAAHANSMTSLTTTRFSTMEGKPASTTTTTPTSPALTKRRIPPRVPPKPSGGQSPHPPPPSLSPTQAAQQPHSTTIAQQTIQINTFQPPPSASTLSSSAGGVGRAVPSGRSRDDGARSLGGVPARSIAHLPITTHTPSSATRPPRGAVRVLFEDNIRHNHSVGHSHPAIESVGIASEAPMGSATSSPSVDLPAEPFPLASLDWFERANGGTPRRGGRSPGPIVPTAPALTPSLGGSPTSRVPSAGSILPQWHSPSRSSGGGGGVLISGSSFTDPSFHPAARLKETNLDVISLAPSSIDTSGVYGGGYPPSEMDRSVCSVTTFVGAMATTPNAASSTTNLVASSGGFGSSGGGSSGIRLSTFQQPQSGSNTPQQTTMLRRQ